MLKERKETHDPANSVIIVIAPGTLEHTPELTDVVQRVADARIRIATITYPSQVRPRPLDWLAETTHGVAFTVMETNYNMATSFITTYFKLTNVFQAIQEHFYQGDKADLPIEVNIFKSILMNKDSHLRTLIIGYDGSFSVYRSKHS